MKTVLVVEDTEDLRELFAEVLRDAGYSVIGAENGLQALELLESMSEEPSLVLLDMMMPIMDGSVFLRELSETPRAALPVVVISASTQRDGVQGARRVVRKPVSPSALKELAYEFCGPP
jgi:two-component system, chemotaxis family, chemotaxis protein CheY